MSQRKKHRILVVLNAFEEDAPTLATLRLMEALAIRGVDLQFVALQRGGPTLGQAAVISGKTPLVLTGLGMQSLLSLRKLFSHPDPFEWVHLVLAAPTIFGLLALRMVPRSKRPPCFVAHHGAHEWSERGPFLRPIVLYSMKTLLPLAQLQGPVSHFTASELHSHISPDLPTQILGNPVPVMAPVPLPDRLSPFRLGAVGRLHPIKNWPTVLRALTRARAAGCVVQIDFVGDGPELPTLQQLTAQLDLQSQVTFHGHLHNWHSLATLWHGGIQPSTQESFGMAAAEMASLGLPVLHSSGGALPEILEEERWCYGAPQNHEALARKFIELQQYTEYLPDLDLLQERRQRSARIQQTYCAERLASYYWQIIQDHLSTYPQAPAL